VLFHERRKQKEMAEAEAQGQSFWTHLFTEDVRNKLVFAAVEAAGNAWAGVQGSTYRILLTSLGVRTLAYDGDPVSDLAAFLRECSDEVYPSVVEAFDRALSMSYRDRYDIYGLQPYTPAIAAFRDRVQQLLVQHRVSYEFNNGQMEPFESKELHFAVVDPTLSLLASKPGWEKVEVCYQKALKEVTTGDPDDAITDAATALQEAFWAAGCKGNALGPLIKDAKNRRLLAPHDQKLTNAISEIADWVSADRVERGDTHKAQSGVTPEDGWLTVHIVGALVVRLSQGVRT